MLSRKSSITLPSMCLVVVVMNLCPALAWAQEQVDNTHCDAIRDEVPRLRERVLAAGEGLEDLAARAKEALDCYNGRLEPRWAIWLLTNRVYTLNRLQRYDEAQETFQIIPGTPDTVVEKLKKIIALIDPGHIVLWGREGPMSHKVAMRSIDLMTQEVIPAIKEYEAVR